MSLENNHSPPPDSRVSMDGIENNTHGELEKQQKRREQHRLSARNYRARKKAEVNTMQTRMREMATQNELLLREIQILRARLASGEVVHEGAPPEQQPNSPSALYQQSITQIKKYAAILSRLRASLNDPSIADHHIIQLLDGAYGMLLGISSFTTDQCHSCPYHESEQCICSPTKPSPMNPFTNTPGAHLISHFYPCAGSAYPQVLPMHIGEPSFTPSVPAYPPSFDHLPHSFLPCIHNCRQCPNINCPNRTAPSNTATVHQGNLYPCIQDCSECRNMNCKQRRGDPPLHDSSNPYPCINNCSVCKNINCPSRTVPKAIPSSLLSQSFPADSQHHQHQQQEEGDSEFTSRQHVSVPFCQPFLLGKLFYVLFTGMEDPPKNEKAVFERWLREQLVTVVPNGLEEAVSDVMRQLTAHEAELTAVLKRKKEIIVGLWGIASPYADAVLSPFAVPFTSSHCSLSPGVDMQNFADASTKLREVISTHHKILFKILSTLRTYSAKVEARLFLGRHPFSTEDEMIDVLLRMII
ncbi:hypothetical protein GEMRC1_005556 [Eukaryota sp. GEM-RC1]